LSGEECTFSIQILSVTGCVAIKRSLAESSIILQLIWHFSTITLAEILFGIKKSPVKKKVRRLKIERISLLLDLYPFDEAAAGKYAVVRTQLERQGTPISERDTQIAAIAMANSLTVVTHNVKEFIRIKDLKVEDWAS